MMAWHRLGDKPLSEPMMVSLSTHICVTLPPWVKDYYCGAIASIVLVRKIPDYETQKHMECHSTKKNIWEVKILAKVPDHQYPWCWLNIPHCFELISHRNVEFIVNIIKKLNYIIKVMPLFNSSPPRSSAAYIRQWMGSALVQIMAWRLFGAKPLSQPILGYRQLDP